MAGKRGIGMAGDKQEPPKKKPRERGSRGRGDPRNARMRQERDERRARLEEERGNGSRPAAAGTDPPPSAPSRVGSSFPGVPAAPGTNSNPPNTSRGGTFPHQGKNPPTGPRGSVAAARGRGGLASRGRGVFTQNTSHLRVGPTSSPNNVTTTNNININTNSFNTPSFTTTTTNTTMAPMNAPLWGPWMQWDFLSVTISEVPDYINTFHVWNAFQSQGGIDSIELFENARGAREGRGKIRFKPPPRRPFWLEGNGKYAIPLENNNQIIISVHVDMKPRNGKIPSPTRPNVLYPESVELPVEIVDIGPRVDEKTILPLRTVGGGSREHTRLVLDLNRREINVFFQLTIFDPHQAAGRSFGRMHEYRFRVPFAQLSQVLRVEDTQHVSLVVLLDSPPSYHRKLQDLRSTFVDAANSWRAWDTWYRQTDIVHAPHELASVPINLRKAKPLINIGRWTTFRILFSKRRLNQAKFLTLCDILQDYNTEIKPSKDFKLVENPSSIQTIWKWIDPPSTQSSNSRPSSLDDLAGGDYIHLPFVVRYQLEVCISHGYLNEYTIGRDFFLKLQEMDEKKAKDLLEHVASEKTVYYNPMDIFEIKFVKAATNARIPPYCCYMRSARVTPSMIYYNTPTVDISNRVIRHYIEYADRFLRVRFTDEKMQGRINSTMNSSMDEVFTRIKRAMSNGITIGDRHYEFLAFGNSQFREHGAYFFAPVSNLTASNIRAWMGSFSDIKSIAKHAARLGQCFSTTRAITGCPVQIQEIDDIERNGYTFSDGVGRISNFLAQMAMGELKIRTPGNTPPSVFQFRLGGCKGILTISPEAKGQEIHIRPSQYKFPAIHNGLEIIRYSQFSMATLNRQIIVVLSALGVDDEVFKEKLRTMMASLELAMTSESQAIHLLQKYVDPNQMTLALADMVLDGFQKSKEPFVTSLLELWRAWQIKYLKEKAKIVIDKGACLFGCIDETATLKGYYDAKQPKPNASLQERIDALPEIFVQISRADRGGKYEVIEGLCLLARNPSLHPGDIRVVKAVNAPKLHHLKDVIVLPQTGDRDISSMCSGGDLDGDDYLVIWDQDMLPKDWFRAPMDYSAPKAPVLSRPVAVNDITSFFVTYIKNDRLPQIAHAHLAFADYLEDGVNDPKCMRLAAHHSAAVDYNKTGIPVNVERELQPRKWPHFMEKKYKPKEAIYYSRKILGQLYDIVERVDFIPSLDAPFDERILDCGIEVSEGLLTTAKELKSSYDEAMRRIMAQHEIKSEFEIWSTFVLSHANMSKDYKFHEELGQISSSLRDRFVQACYAKAGGRHFDCLAPLAIAMYRITNDEMVAALKRYRQNGPGGTISPEDMDKLPFISFPWLLRDTLGKIANRHYEEDEYRKPDMEHQTRSQPAATKTEGQSLLVVDPDVETAAGIQHAGEILELFQEAPTMNADPFASLSDDFGKNHPEEPPKMNGSAENKSSLVLLDLDENGSAFSQPASAVSSQGAYQNSANLLDNDPLDDLPSGSTVTPTKKGPTMNGHSPAPGSQGGNSTTGVNGHKTEIKSSENSIFTSREHPSSAISREVDVDHEPIDTGSQKDVMEVDGVGPTALDQLAKLIGDED